MLLFYEMIITSALYCTKMLIWICIALYYWNSNLWIDMSLPSDSSLWFRFNTSFLLLWVLSGEVANTNLAVFGLIILVLELIIFPTQGEHVTYYTVNRVLSSPDKQSMITIDVHLLLFSLFFCVYKFDASDICLSE